MWADLAAAGLLLAPVVVAGLIACGAELVFCRVSAWMVSRRLPRAVVKERR